MTAVAAVWSGPESLRPFLVPLDSLEPFPGNPRRGNVEKIVESLRELGQRRPIVVDGTTITAGHHVVLAARELGWTHVAALDGGFEDEDQARRFLLADNRVAELGGVDPDLLAVQLAALRDGYQGTGYSADDRRELEERLASLRRPTFPESSEQPPRLDERSTATGLFEVPLLLGREERDEFARLVGVLRREWGLDATTAVVVRAVREAAERT